MERGTVGAAAARGGGHPSSCHLLGAVDGQAESGCCKRYAASVVTDECERLLPRRGVRQPLAASIFIPHPMRRFLSAEEAASDLHWESDDMHLAIPDVQVTGSASHFEDCRKMVHCSMLPNMFL